MNIFPTPSNPYTRRILFSIIKGKGRCDYLPRYCIDTCPIKGFCDELHDLHSSPSSIFYDNPNGLNTLSNIHIIFKKRFDRCLDLYIDLYGEQALKNDLVEDSI